VYEGRTWSGDVHGVTFDDPTFETNGVGTAGYANAKTESFVSEASRWVWDVVDGEVAGGHSERTTSVVGESSEAVQGATSFLLVTWLDYDIVHTGNVSRIANATFYAGGTASYYRKSEADINSQDAKLEYTNRMWTVMFRVGDAQEAECYEYVFGGTTNRLVAFSISFDAKSLVKRAMGMSCGSWRNAGWHPSLEYKVPDATEDRTLRDAYTTERLSCNINTGYLVIDFHPWTSLPEW
jgi:hypothetical protein